MGRVVWRLPGAVICTVIVYSTYVWVKHRRALSALPNLYRGQFGSVLAGGIARIPSNAHEIGEKLDKGILSISILNNYMVFINDASIMKRVFMEHGHATSGRPRISKWSWTRKFDGGFLTTDGMYASHLRRLAMAALRDLGTRRSHIERMIQQQAMSCCEAFLTESQGTKPVSPKPILAMATTNVFTNLCYGTTFEYSDPTFLSLLKASDDILQYGLLADYRQLLPFEWMTELPFVKNESVERRKRGFKVYDDFTFSKIREWTRENDLVGGCKSDLLSVFLATPLPNGEKISHRWISRIFIDLVNAGAETTATTLNWTVKCLAADRPLQDRLYRELKHLDLTCLSASDLAEHNLHLTNAVIHESLRFAATLPLTPPHVALEGFTLECEGERCVIPRGTVMLGNLWSMNHNRAVWRDPEHFNPEDNFLDPESGQFSRPDGFLPFGVGPRGCFGEKLARSELLIILATLVLNCVFEQSGGDWDLGAALSGAVRNPAPYTVIVKHRDEGTTVL